MKKLLLILFILFLFNSCEKEPIPQKEEVCVHCENNKPPYNEWDTCGTMNGMSMYILTMKPLKVECVEVSKK